MAFVRCSKEVSIITDSSFSLALFSSQPHTLQHSSGVTLISEICGNPRLGSLSNPPAITEQPASGCQWEEKSQALSAQAWGAGKGVNTARKYRGPDRFLQFKRPWCYHWCSPQHFSPLLYPFVWLSPQANGWLHLVNHTETMHPLLGLSSITANSLAQSIGSSVTHNTLHQSSSLLKPSVLLLRTPTLHYSDPSPVAWTPRLTQLVITPPMSSFHHYSGQLLSLRDSFGCITPLGVDL